MTWIFLTLEQFAGKVDAHVSVPDRVGPGIHRFGDLVRLDLLHLGEDSITSAKAGNDLGDSEEERLNPPLHQFAVEAIHLVWERICAVVLSSTQLMGLPCSSGLASQTASWVSKGSFWCDVDAERHTGVDFATKAKNCLAYAGANDGAILSLVVDNFFLAVFDVVSGSLSP